MRLTNIFYVIAAGNVWCAENSRAPKLADSGFEHANHAPGAFGNRSTGHQALLDKNLENVISGVPTETWQIQPEALLKKARPKAITSINRVAPFVQRGRRAADEVRPTVATSRSRRNCPGETPRQDGRSADAALPESCVGDATSTSRNPIGNPVDVKSLYVRTRARHNGETEESVLSDLDSGLGRLAARCDFEFDGSFGGSTWLATAPKVQEYMKGYVQLKTDLHGINNVTNDNVLRHAQAQIDSSTIPYLPIARMCDFAKIESVERWIAANTNCGSIKTSIEVLKAVYAAGGRPPHELLKPNGELANIDPFMLRAACRVYARLRQEPDKSTGDLSSKVLERRFVDDLNADLQELRQASLLIPASNPRAGQPALWFTGSNTRGALNANVRTLAAKFAPHLFAAPELSSLLARRLQSLGESADYNIGTPHQSMATIVLRFGPRVGIGTTGLAQIECLTASFKQLVLACDSPEKCPIDPLYAAARHLAGSSGVLFSHRLTKGQLLTREVRTRLSPVWRTTDDLQWWQLESFAAGNKPHSGGSFKEQAIRMYRQIAANTEIIAAKDAANLRERLCAYFKERVAAYQPMPVFNREAAAADLMMEEFQIERHQLCQEHTYRVWEDSGHRCQLGSHSPSLWRSGNWIDEFFYRRKCSDSRQSNLVYEGIELDTVGGLNSARERFNDVLDLHPVVRAKAREAIRLLGKHAEPESLALISKAIASRHIQVQGQNASPPRTVPISHLIVDSIIPKVEDAMVLAATIRHIVDTIATGDPAKIIQLLPFVGAGYEIGEGVWQGDWSEVGEGVLHGVEDTILLFLGAWEDRQAAREMEAALALPAIKPLESPLTSMMREYDYEMRQLEGGDVFSDEQSRPADMRDNVARADDGVGVAASFEFSYAEQGTGADGEGVAHLPGLRGPYREPPTGPGKIRRTVEDVGRIFDNIDVLMEADKDDGSLLGCLFGRASPSCEISTYLTGQDPASNFAINLVADIAKKSPTLDWLTRGAALRKMKPFAVRTTKNSPHTQLSENRINLAPPGFINRRNYLTPTGDAPFQYVESCVHESIHAISHFTDNVDAEPSLHRGPIVALTELVLYEAGYRYPPRIMYQRRFALQENEALHLNQEVDRTAARSQALEEDFQIQKLMRNLDKFRLKNLKIFGSRLSEWTTVKSAMEVAEWLGIGAGKLPHGEITKLDAPGLGEWLTLHDAPRPALGDLTSADFLRIFDEQQAANYSFSNTISVFTNNEKRIWHVHFGVLRPAGSKAAPWHLDDVTGTLHIYSGSAFYASRIGPLRAPHEHIVSGIFSELAFRKLLDETTVNGQTDRGGLVWLTDKMLGTEDTETQRVNGLWSSTASDELWSETPLAAKIASDEDAYLANRT